METPQADLPSSRHWRAIALMGIAVIVIAAASGAYVGSTRTSKPQDALPSVDPRLATSNPVDYTFVTPSVGWASLVVVGPSPGSGRFLVFRTVDGAKHWQLQLGGPGGFPGFSPIAVQFFGLTGFMTIAGPVEHLYRTADGGAHWVAVPLPSLTIEAIKFSDASTGWLSGSLALSTGPPSRLYATHDAGASWTRLPEQPADAWSLAFRRPTEAWMGAFGPGPPHVYSTSDAGRSWQRYDLPPPAGSAWDPTMGFQVVSDLLPGAGVVVSAFGECAQNGCLTPGPSYFMSSNGGTTWKPVPPPPGSLVYQDAVHWWATGENAVYKSADAGQSWTRIATISPGLQFIKAGVLDAKRAWSAVFVMGGYGLVLTNDGGLHWTQANVPRPPSPILGQP